MTKRPSAVFLISVLSSTAFAASAEDDIVVSATRSPAPLSEVGSSVAVITADDFRARQYSFVIDALRDAAGVSVVRNGGAGGAASARIRGATSGQTLVVIDGIVVNDPAAPQGGFNFANLDVADIDRIEVLRGPQSLLYGADAIGGVIAITTTKSDTATSAYLEGGSRASLRGGATAAAGDDGAWGRITVSGQRTGGISRAATGAEKDGYRSVAGSAAGGVAINETWRAEITARYSDSHAEIDGFPPPLFTFADTAETEDTTDYAVAGRLVQESAHYEGALTVSYNAIDRKNFDAGFETFAADGDRLSADYLGALRLSEAVRLFAGAEVERTSVNVSGVDESADAGAVFAMIEAKPVPAVTVSGGVRRDEFSNFEGATTARVAAVWAAPGEVFLRGSWGQGFRAPSLFELNFDQFGVTPNPDLRPEKANGIDFGVEKRFGADRRFAVTLFRTRVEDQIDFDFAGNGYFNIDETRARGVEIEGAWRLGGRVTAEVVYAFTDAKDLGTGTQLLRQPKHKGVAALNIEPLQNLSVSASVIFNGRENDTPAPNNGYIRADIRAAYALSETLELYGRVENVSDSDYEDVSGYAEPGASAFGGVRIRL